MPSLSLETGPCIYNQLIFDRGTMGTVKDFILGGSKITAHGDCSHEIKTLAPSKKIYDQSSESDQSRQHIKKQRYYFANKGPSSQSYGFSSSHIYASVGL